jgi:hypothetical protein
MDEASSDDSEETFVYESNPPENPPRRSRHHSRTPSGQSLASMDTRGVTRTLNIATALLDPQRPVPKTRSMKFSSNSNYGTGDEDHEGLNGTIRVRDRNGGSSIQHHHHMGRSNRNAAGQSAILDEDNPLFPLSKTRSLTAVGGRGSHAARLAAQQLRNSSTNKRNETFSYDLEAEGADDERTPLMSAARTPRGTIRAPRSTRSRYYDSRGQPISQQKNLLARVFGCILILVTLCLLGFGVVCFLFAMSKPLMDVTIVDIKEVIASEQEIMLDIVVSATNPNLVPITISDMDVNLFAKSKYVGSQKWWRDHGSIPDDDSHPGGKPGSNATAVLRKPRVRSIIGNGDLITIEPIPPEVDPHSNETSSKQTMLLGHVLHFDSPLLFDGSFWKREPHFSTGSLRLSKPGNQTEAGGTERWEHVLKHDFDLIIRGVLRYSIPLGGRTVSVPITGETPVDGSGGDDDETGGDPGGDDSDEKPIDDLKNHLQ